jgi:hypothetical protein
LSSPPEARNLPEKLHRTQFTHAILVSKLPYIAAPRTAWKDLRCNPPNTRTWACGSPLGILHSLRTIRDLGLGTSGSCMPGDLHIRYCSRILADSLAVSPCSRVGKSMTGPLRIPGKQRSAHMVKAGTGSGGQPAQASRLQGKGITCAITAKNAIQVPKVYRQLLTPLN